MKRNTLFLAATILGCLGVGAQKIYVTDVPTVANLKVYVVNSPVNADLTVYKANSPIYPGVDENEGIWYFVNMRTTADKTIYFVSNPTIADLKIYFTTIPTAAGWRTPSKRPLLNP